ncbi:hypothetical protein ES702_06689 [subsurface metagenome]
MAKISNIDAIIELVLREARARAEQDLTGRIAMVLTDVIRKACDIIDTEKQDQRRQKDD